MKKKIGKIRERYKERKNREMYRRNDRNIKEL